VSETEDVDISVIVPTYNMAEYLGTAIDSVLEQGFDAFEVLVVDDGSTDDTEEVVAPYAESSYFEYDERVRYVSQSNQGKAAAVNHGLDLARGTYVTILDADDKLPPDSLSTRYAHREDEYGRKRDLIIGGFEVFDEQSSYGARFPPEQADAEELRRAFYLRWKTPFHLNACLIARSLIQRVGGLDERFRRCLDGDYAMRLLAVAERVALVQSVVYQYRKYRASKTKRLRKRLQTAKYRVRVVAKNYHGLRRLIALPFGIAMDTAKLLYELVVGNYKQ
jgi:glycosyltransferase involved in cell wall biosynthesis